MLMPPVPGAVVGSRTVWFWARPPTLHRAAHAIHQHLACRTLGSVRVPEPFLAAHRLSLGPLTWRASERPRPRLVMRWRAGCAHFGPLIHFGPLSAQRWALHALLVESPFQLGEPNDARPLRTAGPRLAAHAHERVHYSAPLCSEQAIPERGRSFLIANPTPFSLSLRQRVLRTCAAQL